MYTTSSSIKDSECLFSFQQASLDNPIYSINSLIHIKRQVQKEYISLLSPKWLSLLPKKPAGGYGKQLSA